MSETPPVGPPIVFRYNSRLVWMSNLSTLLFAAVAVGSIFLTILALWIHGRWLGMAVIAFLSSLFAATGILRLMLTLGATVEVVGDRIIVRNRKRKIVQNALFSKITRLKAMVRRDEAKPYSYELHSNDKGYFPIFAELDNVEQLVEIIETRTGKRFEYPK